MGFGGVDAESSRPGSLPGQNEDCLAAKTEKESYQNIKNALDGFKPRLVNTMSRVRSE